MYIDSTRDSVNKKAFLRIITLEVCEFDKKCFWFRAIISSAIMNAIEVRLCVVNAAPSESRWWEICWQNAHGKTIGMNTRGLLNFYLTHCPCLPYWVCSKCLLKAPPATQETGWRQATREIKLLAGLAMRQLTTEDLKTLEVDLKNYFPQSLQVWTRFFEFIKQLTL